VRSGNKIILIIAGIAAVIFLYEIEQLFNLGFTTGENYPVYSSFRSDPLGARALYGALGSLRGVSVERNIKPLTKIGGGRGKTLILCGADTSPDPVEAIKAIEAFIADGGRFVVTFFPELQESAWYLPPEEKKEEKKKDEKKQGDAKDAKKPDKKEEQPSEQKDIKFESIEKRWEFSFAHKEMPTSGESKLGDTYARKVAGPVELPARLSWRTALYFDQLGKAWRTLYALDGHSVVIERRMGKGSIVLCSDSYLLSNEAMRNGRYSALLAWLVGQSSSVIFDETHLGVETEPEVMTLIRNYRLHWALISLIVVAMLFVWRNATSLVPRRPEGENVSQSLKGKDSTAGLVNLLRRSVPANKVVNVCLDEWQASFARDPKFKAANVSRARAIAEREAGAPAMKGDPVKAYVDIYTILSKRS